MKKVRLDKYLADSGAGTRSEVKKLIGKGHIRINDIVVSDAGIKINEGDKVTLDGELLIYEDFTYFMLNKPRGYVSAREDSLNKTVMELFKDEKVRGLSHVGRLDIDTEGLLLITNDGKLSHELLAPGKHVPKTYFIISDRELSDNDEHLIRDGIDIGDDKPCQPAVLEKLEGNTTVMASDGESISGPAYTLTITEGRYHQVKRMFQACDARVIYLKRLSMGDVSLDESLKCGEYRRLTDEELNLLKR